MDRFRQILAQSGALGTQIDTLSSSDADLVRKAAKEAAHLFSALPNEKRESALIAFVATLSAMFPASHDEKATGALRSDPVPAEVLAEAQRSFNESEILATMAEIRSGCGRRLEDFLPELEKVASRSGDVPQS